MAPSNGVDSFVIIVSEEGFNGTAGNLNMSVTSGDTVKIKFIYGDACPAKLQLPGCDSLAFDNPHQLDVQGYSVEVGRHRHGTQLVHNPVHRWD